MVSSLPNSKNKTLTDKTLTLAVANVWLAGGVLDWDNYYDEQHRCRLELPTYPFERQRYWIEEVRDGALQQKPQQQYTQAADLDDTDPQTMAAFDECQLSIKLVVDGETLEPKDGKKLLQDMMTLRFHIKELCTKYFNDVVADVRISPINVYSQSSKQRQDTPLMQSLTERPNITSPYVDAKTDLQKELVGHWQEVLGIRTIGIHDNFFDIGGNSLIAAALVTKMRNRFDFEIPLAELLERPTIAQLSDFFETKMWLKESQQAVEDDSNAESTEIKENFDEVTL
jgi:acyl carrier protein